MGLSSIGYPRIITSRAKISWNIQVTRNNLNIMELKRISHSITFSFLSVLFIQTMILVSCGEGKSRQESKATQKYDGVIISVDISNRNCLDILLANDGTINRKGNGMPDTLDNNFFMGITKDKFFDSLMNGISN